MITRNARKALRLKRQGKAKTVSGIPLDDPWLTENETAEAERQRAYDEANKRHPLPLSGTKE